ncbi:MAG: carboxylating nicotinate-nucleotide diphosphorylase [Methanospirillum sp.]
MTDIPLARLLAFVAEDAPFGDVTSDAVLGDQRCTAVLRFREAGIAAGLAEAAALFAYYGVVVTASVADGDRVEAGATALALEGPVRSVLLVERTALNLVGRMSGIATATARYVALAGAGGGQVRVAATRKTAPGLGLLDKKAVLLGGGDPHRFTLSDGVLIKDNHLALVPIEEAVRRARAFSAYKTVEVEVETADEAVRAARAGADIVLLDNMTPVEAREALASLESAEIRDRVRVEVSGGITEATIGAYAALGVDLVSVGALTHSVRSLDLTLEVVAPQPAD